MPRLVSIPDCPPFAPWLNRLERSGRPAILFLLGFAVTWSFWGTRKPDCQDLDFGSYYRAADAVWRGATPYQIDSYGPLGVYPYAPAYAYLLAPLSCLDYLWACRLWMVVNWLATAAALLLTLRLVLGPERSREGVWSIALLAAVPTASYLWTNLREGQVGMLMLLACLGWAACARRGRPFVGGLLLALACGLKLAPGVLVLYLVVRRDLRGLAGVAVGGAALFLLPVVCVGWDGALRLHEEWIHHTAATHIPAQTYRPGNQSLLAQLARLPAISNGHTCYSVENLDYLYRVYPWIVAGLTVGLLGWIACSRRADSAEGQRRRDNLHLALLLILLTLAHPRAWRCNFVALLLPCVLLAERVWRRLPGAGAALAALAFLTLVCAWPTNGVGEGAWTVGAWLLLGKHFWGAVAVAGACCWGLARPAVGRLGPENGWQSRNEPPGLSRRDKPAGSFPDCTRNRKPL